MAERKSEHFVRQVISEEDFFHCVIGGWTVYVKNGTGLPVLAKIELTPLPPVEDPDYLEVLD